MQGGKDIGWMFVTEELGERQGESGFFVASLSECDGEKEFEGAGGVGNVLLIELEEGERGVGDGEHR